MLVWMVRSGRWPLRTTCCRPAGSVRWAWASIRVATSASMAWASIRRAPSRRTSVRTSWPVGKAVPFLSARRVEKYLQAPGHLSDLLDRPADRLRRTIQVQDQAIPQTLGRLQAVRPLGDHPRLVVDPLHRPTRLA